MTTIIIAIIAALIAIFIITMGVLAYRFEPDTETYTYMDLIRAWRDSKKSVYVETHPLMIRLDKEAENSPVAVMLRNIR